MSLSTSLMGTVELEESPTMVVPDLSDTVRVEGAGRGSGYLVGWSERLAQNRNVRPHWTYPSAENDLLTDLHVSHAPSTGSAGPPRGQVASQLLAEWHGQVTEVLATTFAAQLKGRHGAGVFGKEDIAIIPRAEVRPDDEELLVPGAFFSLCVSYEVSRRGRRRFTEVVFRRLPAYRREELEQAEARGREIARGLRLE